MIKKTFDLFIFSSLFIALCAVLMVNQVHSLFHLVYPSNKYLLFVFFSTLASYNFHWYLTPDNISEIERCSWSRQHKELHLTLTLLGTGGALYFILYFTQHWLALGVAAILTFLYSAPKIPHPLFHRLKRIAVGKTFYLSFVWLYVTTILPFIFTKTHFTMFELAFCFSRFLLIYAICIIFDYRDRNNDKKEGIRSLIGFLREKQINFIFYCSLFLFLVFNVWLGTRYLNWDIIASLTLPGLILVYLYPKTKNNFSDYLYYFVLDGLMALSSLITLFISI
ncbi:MAG: hypothetical protein GC171_05035 [Terrimonas sp.]|nr:hypothetical protein [Terrimonas sp.]